MITLEGAKHLWDARQAIAKIERFTSGCSLDDFLSSDLVRSAVERQFEIVGEAFTRLRRLDPVLADSIPDLPQAIAFRNLLIHGYDTLDHRRVWGVVTESTGGLRDVLDRLLASAP